MIPASPEAWLALPSKRIVLFGMSGLGKTHASRLLRAAGWFHYSVDYRIGTRYMGELIADNAKREAMRVPFLRELLLSDSIYIGSNITFENLDPVSTYLGKPGDPDLGGLPFAEYVRRQAEFREAEVASLLDAPRFAERAASLYGYSHFVCDTGGSICEWVDPDDEGDPVLSSLAATALLVWIEGSPEHEAELVRRFDRAPKPMAYHPDFLAAAWAEFGAAHPGPVDPDAFIRWAYARALAHRQPRYAAMAARWGVTVPAEAMAGVADEAGLTAVVADAIGRRMRA